ncbi:hypothetical protein H072_6931 [Dactylellina haptotyla CBS 200.50]|uniref:Major facilitator superfamily (MFS) profile domain-containing protein n=1 Tax=Dactylellina haptotyla (strain CBS 200.50) TaxID=1284197 RepID=S8BJ82_DACHA|nr:hypothetical protein H072_6931 [Dactylellina haptotyla CBS 200.50]
MTSSNTATGVAYTPIQIKRILILISLIVLSESLSSTILLPFVYFMVRDFGIDEDETQIGSRAGFITSSFFLAQMLMTTMWGMISDRWGRRPVLLMGLLGNTISLTLFGTSSNLFYAILFRSCCGILNGNIAVARTSVGELAVRANLDQAKAFSLFGFCSALGFVVGPLIGGSLSNPARLGIEGPNQIFVHFPYLLPCIAGAAVSAVTFISSIFFLNETNEAVWKQSEIFPEPEVDDERQPLLSTPTPAYDGNTPILEDGIEEKAKIEPTAFWCIFCASIMCLHSIIFDELFPLFAAASSDGNVGLGYTASQIASALSLMGIVIFFAQLVLYPLLNVRFNTLSLWRVSTASFVFIYPLFPLIPGLARSGYLVQKAVILVCMASRFTAIVIAYTSINILMNNSTTAESRGLVNGVAQSFVSFARSIGPALGGVIWSWSLSNGYGFPFNRFFLFLLLSVFAILQFLFSFMIPGRIATKRDTSMAVHAEV